MTYLTQMENAGLILKIEYEDSIKYSITEKGRQLISEFNKMQGWVKAFGLEL